MTADLDLVALLRRHRFRRDRNGLLVRGHFARRFTAELVDGHLVITGRKTTARIPADDPDIDHLVWRAVHY